MRPAPIRMQTSFASDSEDDGSRRADARERPLRDAPEGGRYSRRKTPARTDSVTADRERWLQVYRKIGGGGTGSQMDPLPYPW